MSRAVVGPDKKPRCSWSYSAPDFVRYHDEEWGVPVGRDQDLFEKLCLESFQSGLSWRTILAKREAFREAFHGFDIERVARFTKRDINRLLNNQAIVRNRAKIEAAIANARATETLIADGSSLAALIWSYEPDTKTLPPPQTRTTCPESLALSKSLKKMGFWFVGPTTMYSLFQAMGLINDHVEDCIGFKKIESARRRFRRPR